jgi:NADH dehydrogenase/NADH:ubiquinone oxidoreductase subunit G
MNKIKLTIDGLKIDGLANSTILETATQAGIEIPTLCHNTEIKPTGACRLCVVEVEGARTLVGSCHTPIAEGMVVHTRSPKVLATRKVIVELLLTAHTGDCVNDPNAENCRLHLLASDLEVGPPRFKVKKPRYYQAEDENPHVRRDLSKCILCQRCVEACREIANKNLLSIGFRGFKSKIVTGFDEPLADSACEGCSICIDNCPTGALAKPIRNNAKRKAVN